MRALTCLIFILTNSVIAQAEFQPVDQGNIQLKTQSWVATYAGETEIDGLPVIAAFEEVKAGADIPQMIAQVPQGEVLVPSLLPVIRPAYRLTLTISHRPIVRAIYEISPSTVSIDGELRTAYLSSANDERGFQFVVTPREDGSFHVTYTRRSLLATLAQGEFELYPVPHTL